MFKGINRGVTAWIYIKNLNQKIQDFLWNCVKQEKILPITLSKVLKYNLEETWFDWESLKLEIEY
jgi:hypothetical protein